MRKIKYVVTTFILCDGYDTKGRFMRRWRKARKYGYDNKRDAMRCVAWWVTTEWEKATIKKIR